MRKFIKVSKYNNIKLNHPKRATTGSAGYDLYVSEDTFLKKDEITLVPTGHKVLMEDGDVCLIYARSSLALKHKLFLANGVGVIDKDYFDSPDTEGEIFIPILNKQKDIILKKNERIAQAIFVKYLLEDNEEMQNAKRIGGFGSTDIKK